MKELFYSSNVFKFQKENLIEGKLSHAYLILSSDSLTNEEYAKAFAQLLVCETNKPCGTCENCLKAACGTHPDILFFPDGKKNIVVEDTAKITDEANIKPMLSERKIFILNNFDLATVQAQNKMLKLLEEPPKNVVFLLTAVNENKVARTIISRSVKINIPPLGQQTVSSAINSQETQEDNLAIKFGGGFLGKTLELKKRGDFVSLYNEVLSIITKMKSSKDVIKFSCAFSENKEDFDLKLELLYELFGEFLKAKLSGEFPPEFIPVKDEYTIEAITRILEEIENAKKKKDFNVNQSIITDNLFLKILEVKYLCK